MTAQVYRDVSILFLIIIAVLTVGSFIMVDRMAKEIDEWELYTQQVEQACVAALQQGQFPQLFQIPEEIP